MNMCEHCNFDEPLSPYPFICMSNGKPSIKAAEITITKRFFRPRKEKTLYYFKVNYCPMCGRELNKQEG